MTAVAILERVYAAAAFACPNQGEMKPMIQQCNTVIHDRDINLSMEQREATYRPGGQEHQSAASQAAIGAYKTVAGAIIAHDEGQVMSPSSLQLVPTQWFPTLNRLCFRFLRVRT
ncbi:hypothetical protein RB195_008873 [Necator americanus]